MRLHPQPRRVLDVEAAERLDSAFQADIAGRPLSYALDSYRTRLDGLLREAVEPLSVACGAGCDTCCHQPLLVSFVELGTLFFSDEARFGSAEFRRGLRAATRALGRWKAAPGRPGAVGIAERQFSDRGACVLLGDDGRCTVYDARPFLCRNAVALTRCTWTDFQPFGFGDLAAFARRLRGRIHERYELSRFDRGGVRVATAAFYLPEGLAWFADQLPRDELRSEFCAP